MKKQFSLAALACTVLLTMLAPMTTLAAGSDEGRFTDFDNLTWTTWDGVSTTYGRGPKFSDLHPEITDPEYFLKEHFVYPGEEASKNNNGVLKQNDTYSSLDELRSFVNRFDWIHSDELTRAEMVFKRIANGQHGNQYDTLGFQGEFNVGYRVLRTGKGICENFSEEFASLANFVGLECVVYPPYKMHQACLLKINGQWFAVDPTVGSNYFLSNGTTYPVDYETELHRYEKEEDAKWSAENVENPKGLTTLKLIELNKQFANGTITSEQFDLLLNEAEKNDLNRKLASGVITIDQYNNYLENKK